MFEITPAGKYNDVTKLTCPCCRKKVSGVVLEKDSKVDGLLFACSKCHNMWKLKTK